jgi:hypothetical protein
MEDPNYLKDKPVAFSGMSPLVLVSIIVGTAIFWGMLFWGLIGHLFY